MLAVLAGIYVWLWRDEAKSDVRSTRIGSGMRGRRRWQWRWL